MIIKKRIDAYRRALYMYHVRCNNKKVDGDPAWIKYRKEENIRIESELYDRSVDYIVKFLIEEQIISDFVDEYGEPGYTNTSGEYILFADWNEVPDSIVEKIISDGRIIEWSDEWVVQYDEMKAYRNSSDSMFWVPSFVVIENEICSKEWCLGNTEEYIEYLLEENESDNFDVDFAKFGFIESDIFYKISNVQRSEIEQIIKMADEIDYDCIIQNAKNDEYDLSYKIFLRKRENDEYYLL